MPKKSCCNVNVRFNWNYEKGLYERQEGFKLVHDHRLEIDERCFLNNQIMRDIKHFIMANTDVKPSEIIAWITK